jgi:hypothetical protein
MDEKMKERIVRIGKCIHWKVGNDIKLKTPIKKEVCQQNYNVWQFMESEKK